MTKRVLWVLILAACRTGASDAGMGRSDGVIDASTCRYAATPTLTSDLLMATGRYAPGAVALTDGRVLILGGYEFATDKVTTSAELFDPRNDTLVPTGPLVAGRNFPVAVRLLDGRVFVAGGYDPTQGSLLEAEIYAPDEGTFSYVVDSMQVGREAHAATVLLDGRVLVTGGLQANGFSFHRTVDLYDPATKRFAPTADMSVPRAFHVSMLLPSGDVLIVGGDSGAGELTSAEVFQVEKRTFRSLGGGLPRAAKALAAAPLADGRILITGGQNATDDPLKDATIFDPRDESFTAASPLATGRMAHQLTTLADGRVLASGGYSRDTEVGTTKVLEVYDPARDAWTTLSVPMAHGRHDHVALLLPDCRVLLAGGVEGPPVPAPRTSPREVEMLTLSAR